jgi:hypothetical protein
MMPVQSSHLILLLLNDVPYSVRDSLRGMTRRVQKYYHRSNPKTQGDSENRVSPDSVSDLRSMVEREEIVLRDGTVQD